MRPAEMDALGDAFRAWLERRTNADECAFAEQFEDGFVAAAFYAGRQSAPAHTPTPDVLVRMAGAVANALAESGYFDGNIADLKAEDVCEAILEAMHSILPTLSEQRPQIDAFLAADRYRKALEAAREQLIAPYTVLLADQMRILEAIVVIDAALEGVTNV